MTKPTIQQISLDTITITSNSQSIDIPFDDALYVASELKKIWQVDYDSLPFSVSEDKMLQLLRKKRVVKGKGEKMTTFCPMCFYEVEVRNEKAAQYASHGILCDTCRGMALSYERGEE